MKDPAFLFYPADFLGGVSDLTMEERGQYITLLCNQHQRGYVNTKRVGLVLGLEWVSLSSELRSKFIVDENGEARNERLAAEMERRVNFAEKQRINGQKGGRPKNPNKSQTKPNPKPKQNPNESPRVETITITENINEDREEGGTGGEEKPRSKSDEILHDTFETFRRDYDGKKRGHDTELAVLGKHRDWRDVVMRLPLIIAEQKRWRIEAQRHGVFIPSWPNLQTWLNQRRWEEELNFNFETQSNGKRTSNNQSRGNALDGDYLADLARRAGVSN